jgi:DNA-binding transcriptional regulator YhcF (GntR family)
MPKRPAVPLFAQIFAHYVAGTRHGDVGIGDTLPGTRAMAARWETSPTTISRALFLLEAEGYIRRDTASYPVFLKGRAQHWREPKHLA